MKIGIFSKLGAKGGSEHRVVEIANSIVRFSDHEVMILAEKGFNGHLSKKLDERVIVALEIFKGKNPDHSILYDMDVILVINTDSYSFSKLDYWVGETKHHDARVDLTRIPRMVFLYNFVISPAQWLGSIATECSDVRIICANKNFYAELIAKDKFRDCAMMPRMILESPIDPDTIPTEKKESKVIRIGKHSMPHGYKFNEDHTQLIEAVNKRFAKQIQWDFLGVPKEMIPSISKFPNVTVREAFSVPVGEYLTEIDIFLFFISWGRNEPWSRAVAEGMTAGCPILATNKAGNRDQVIDGNNGYLCSSVMEFQQSLEYLIENPEVIQKMGRNSRLYSRQFTSQRIITGLLDFIL